MEIHPHTVAMVMKEDSKTLKKEFGYIQVRIVYKLAINQQAMMIPCACVSYVLQFLKVTGLGGVVRVA